MTAFDEAEIRRCIENDDWMMRALLKVTALELPDCWIGAGFVRNKVWDLRHGYATRTPLNDVDVIYFDRHHISPDVDRELENRLCQADATVPWSVRNQARMHLRNDGAPYRSTADAVSYWPETATCVAVRWREKAGLELLAPYGFFDLVDLIVRPSPAFAHKVDIHRMRVRAKNWRALWPKLRFTGPK